MQIFNRAGAHRAAVLAAAGKVMPDKEIAGWLDTPNDDLGGQRPNTLMDDPMGARMVITLLQNRKAAA